MGVNKHKAEKISFKVDKEKPKKFIAQMYIQNITSKTKYIYRLIYISNTICLHKLPTGHKFIISLVRPLLVVVLQHLGIGGAETYFIM